MLRSSHYPTSSTSLTEDVRRNRIRRIGFASLACAVVALSLGGCSGGVLDPKGPISSAERLIFLDALYIMLVIVIPVVIATPAVAWWFRESNTRASFILDWAYSGRVEFIVWAIPVLVVMFLGGITWISSHDLDPAKALPSQSKPLQVQVVSLDWKWLFIYPEQGVASVNELVVPTGAPIHFTLTSASVMNTFFIPQLGSMIYIMNGMETQLNLMADQPGMFHGLSTNFSGDGFSDMAFEVRSVPAGEFDSWVTTARSSTAVLDTPGYIKLAQQGIEAQPFTYKSVQPELFKAVVSQELAPGPGPDIGQSNATVSPRMRH